MGNSVVPPPEQGQLVNVRQRQYVVTEVAKSTLPASPLRPADNGAQHLVSFSSVEDDALGERAEMHKLTVAKLEQGIREPSWATVIALAEALGVDCRAFLEPAGELPEPKRGRPPKARDGNAEEPAPKRPRGRPHKTP
jgi:transcriptional regulator with XRE-family HTH domain